jgi:hypothetical protein
LKTRASQPFVWWALGSNGLDELCKTQPNGHAYFGYRLGFFLSQIAILFRPQTIALTGGIIQENWTQMEHNTISELKANLVNTMTVIPKIVVLKEKDSALYGVAELF